MATNKKRKGVKEKQLKQAKVKQAAKKLQEHRINKYVEQLMAEHAKSKEAGILPEVNNLPNELLTDSIEPITNEDL